MLEHSKRLECKGSDLMCSHGMTRQTETKYGHQSKCGHLRMGEELSLCGFVPS